jgi:F0F1-type ATP synthase membrane subunit b/b'
MKALLKKPLQKAWVSRRATFTTKFAQANEELRKAKQALLDVQEIEKGLVQSIASLKSDIERNTQQELKDIKQSHTERLQALERELELKVAVGQRTLQRSMFADVVDEVVQKVSERLAASYDNINDQKRSQATLRDLSSEGFSGLTQQFSEELKQ